MEYVTTILLSAAEHDQWFEVRRQRDAMDRGKADWETACGIIKAHGIFYRTVFLKIRDLLESVGFDERKGDSLNIGFSLDEPKVHVWIDRGEDTLPGQAGFGGKRGTKSDG